MFCKKTDFKKKTFTTFTFWLLSLNGNKPKNDEDPIIIDDVIM